ncbi:MAG TPA: hypothetical protein VM598_03540 [Bdellovibrionota bacterium]|nr:hypothetical protein [Bdellovibrionota bacterium]
MFTHYLTYSFALNFQRECFLLQLPENRKKSLLESADRMVRQLADAVKESPVDQETRAKALLVSVLCLRDCRQVLEQEGGTLGDLKGPYEVLHGRLERLCSDAHEALERQRHRAQTGSGSPGLPRPRAASLEK